MSTAPIEFFYYTGVPEWPAEDVRAELRGSWTAGGRYSRQWTGCAMERVVSADGCAAFRARVQLQAAEAGRIFEWGVAFLTPEGDIWAIPTEVKDRHSRSQHRLFLWSGKDQSEQYYLTHCRRLGANKLWRAGDPRAGIRFAVWAPHAKDVTVVPGAVWDQADSHGRSGKGRPIPFERLCGGYIADDGTGSSSMRAPIQLHAADDGVWESDAVAPALQDFASWDHQPYMYAVTRKDGSRRFRTDLYSRCQIGAGVTKPSGAYEGLVSDLDGTVSCSVVIDPELIAAEFQENPRVWPEMRFIPQADFWRDEFTDARPPTRPEDLIIYELHIGALGFGRTDASGKPLAGTLADAIAFLDHVSGSGANTIELLPMSEFGESTIGWGYSTSHYFAVEFSGGGRDQYKHFVKAAHQRGLAVILDVVYNHYAHEAERAQRNYDSPRSDQDIYYWYEGVPEQYADPRGGYLDNYSTGDAPAYHEEMVRKLFISSAVALMQDFHVDGFRVDQTTSIHAMNVRRADGQSVPDANIYGAKLLRELGRTLRLIRPDVLLIAEDHSDWSEVTQPVQQGGMGFDLRWGAEFYHHLIGDTQRGDDTAKLIWVAAARAFEQPALAMRRFSQELTNSQYRRVVYSESHDEAGNSGGGPFLDPNWNGDKGKQWTSHRTIVVASNGAYLSPGTRPFAEARCRFAYGVTALSAGTPMFLFGEEVGAERRFKYHGVVTQREDYEGMRYTWGRDLYAFFHDVNWLRRSHAGLRSINIDCVYADDGQRVLAFRRWSDGEEFLVLGSLRDQPYLEGFEFQSDRLGSGQWREIFNSDSATYGGANVGNLGGTIDVAAGRLRCVLPANGLIVFRRV